MHHNQRGGIVSFIIVGVVLAGLLGGALFFSKQQGRQARDATPAPQIAKNSDNSSDSTKKDDKPAETAPKIDTTKSDQPATTAVPTTPKPATPTAPATSSTSTDRVANTGPSAELPSTGPAETTAVVIALGALTFAGYKFMTARRSLRASALRK